MLLKLVFTLLSQPSQLPIQAKSLLNQLVSFRAHKTSTKKALRNQSMLRAPKKSFRKNRRERRSEMMQ